MDKQSEIDGNSRMLDSNLSGYGDSGPQAAFHESLVLVETPLIGKDGRQYIGAPRPLTQLSSKSMSTPLLLSPELPIRFGGNINGRGAIPKKAATSADTLPVVTGKFHAGPIATIPTAVQFGKTAGQ